VKDLRPLLFDIENQRNWNSCGGQDIANYMEVIKRRFKPQEAVELSPAFVWQCAKEFKKVGYHDNVGVTHMNLMAVLEMYGICTESIYPYTDSNLVSKPTQAAYDDAAKRKIHGWKRIDTIEQIKEYLDKDIPTSLLINSPDAIYNVRKPEDWAAVAKSPRSSMAHFVIAAGYDDTGIIIVNSWGEGWGDKGCSTIPYDHFYNIALSMMVITKIDGWFDTLVAVVKKIIPKPRPTPASVKKTKHTLKCALRMWLGKKCSCK
jgi:hypothetical protein